MGLGDRIRSFFAKKNNPALMELEQFAESHKGVEGFIEPKTATSPTTLLLVDRYGEHIRGAVRDTQDAIAFCDRLVIPVYEAAVIGYPKRMKEFDRRARAEAEDLLEAQIDELERRFADSTDDTP